MNTDKPLSSTTSKISFFQKVIRFARNDDNYEEENILEKKDETSVAQKKPLSLHTRDIKAIVMVLMVFYILLCAFILINPQFSLFFNNVFGIEYVTIRFILEYTIYVVYSIFGIFLGVAFLFFGYRSLAIKTKKKFKQTLLWILTVLFG